MGYSPGGLKALDTTEQLTYYHETLKMKKKLMKFKTIFIMLTAINFNEWP